MRRLLSLLKNIDLPLFALTVLIGMFGLLALYSIGLGKDGADFTLLHKQGVFFVVGIIIMLMCAAVDYRSFRQYAKVIFVLSVVLMASVLVFGQTIRGATGWFVLLGYQFQPVEVAKIFLIISLSYFWSSAARPLNQTWNIVKSFLIMGVLFVLTLWQPDLGSAMLLLILWGGYVLIIGLKRWQGVSLIGIGGVVSAIGWFFVLHDYQKDRIRVFFNASHDTLGRGYAVTQSIIAIGAGRLIGRGVGLGSQSQLKFLPEGHADFIFAVISEELGFVGVVVLLCLFVLFFLRLIQLAMKTKDDFALFILIGTILLFFAQTVLNIGVTLGVLPVTGVTLPLVSSGGSSLLASFFLLGIVQSIAMRTKMREHRL